MWGPDGFIKLYQILKKERIPILRKLFQLPWSLCYEASIILLLPKPNTDITKIEELLTNIPYEHRCKIKNKTLPNPTNMWKGYFMTKWDFLGVKVGLTLKNPLL